MNYKKLTREEFKDITRSEALGGGEIRISTEVFIGETPKFYFYQYPFNSSNLKEIFVNFHYLLYLADYECIMKYVKPLTKVEFWRETKCDRVQKDITRVTASIVIGSGCKSYFNYYGESLHNVKASFVAFYYPIYLSDYSNILKEGKLLTKDEFKYLLGKDDSVEKCYNSYLKFCAPSENKKENYKAVGSVIDGWHYNLNNVVKDKHLYKITYYLENCSGTSTFNEVFVVTSSISQAINKVLDSDSATIRFIEVKVESGLVNGKSNLLL